MSTPGRNPDRKIPEITDLWEGENERVLREDRRYAVTSYGCNCQSF